MKKSDNWASSKAILDKINKRPKGFRLATSAENEAHMRELANAGNFTAQRYLTNKGMANAKDPKVS